MTQYNPIIVAKLAMTFAQLTRDLNRLNKVFELNDRIVALRTPAQEAEVIADFCRTSAGTMAFQKRTRLEELNWEELQAMPEDSLGRAYVRFMQERNLRPESIPRKDDRSDIDYIVAHYYETHDLWHVVTGFDTDPAGELGVQAVLMAQSRSYLPLFIMASALLNTAFFSYNDRNRRLDAITQGWLLGKQANGLVGYDWRQNLSRPLKEVRAELGLIRQELLQ